MYMLKLYQFKTWCKGDKSNTDLNFFIKLLKFLERHTVITSQALGMCERLAQGRNSAMRRPGVEPATCCSQVQRPNHYAALSHSTDHFYKDTRQNALAALTNLGRRIAGVVNELHASVRLAVMHA